MIPKNKKTKKLIISFLFSKFAPVDDDVAITDGRKYIKIDLKIIALFAENNILIIIKKRSKIS